MHRFYIRTTQQALNTLIPRTPLNEIFMELTHLGSKQSGIFERFIS